MSVGVGVGVSVGDGVGVSVGDGVGVSLGVGVGVPVGIGAGVGVGLGVGLAVGLSGRDVGASVGLAASVGAGVAAGAVESSDGLGSAKSDDVRAGVGVGVDVGAGSRPSAREAKGWSNSTATNAAVAAHENAAAVKRFRPSPASRPRNHLSRPAGSGGSQIGNDAPPLGFSLKAMAALHCAPSRL
jgi:hypothetical protein